MTQPQPRSAFPIGKLILPIITLVLAVVALVVGAVMTTSSQAALKASFATAQPTPADVYGAQSAIGVAGSILGAGIVGVLLSLAALALVIALTPRQVDQLALLEEEFGFEDLDDVENDAPAATTVRPDSDPVVPLRDPVSPAAAATTPAASVAPVIPAGPAEPVEHAGESAEGRDADPSR